jgi:hypothetical protein
MLTQQTVQWDHQSAIALHKLSEEIAHAKELAYLCVVGRAWPFSNCCNFVSIWLQPILPHYKAKVLQFWLKECALLSFSI